MKRVLVIVVTYNGMQWLQRCLDSVVADADLYVFDNASTDGSADYVESHYPQALLVRSAVNLGFSKPNNLGMRYALDKGGVPHGVLDPGQAGGLPAEKAAARIVRAGRRGRREVLVGRGELLMVFIKRFFPGLCARLSRRLKPM